MVDILSRLQVWTVSFTIELYRCHIWSSLCYDKLIIPQVCLPVLQWAKAQASYFRHRGLSFCNVCVPENIITFYFNVLWLFPFATDGAMELSFTRSLLQVHSTSYEKDMIDLQIYKILKNHVNISRFVQFFLYFFSQLLLLIIINILSQSVQG